MSKGVGGGRGTSELEGAAAWRCLGCGGGSEVIDFDGDEGGERVDVRSGDGTAMAPWSARTTDLRETNVRLSGKERADCENIPIPHESIQRERSPVAFAVANTERNRLFRIPVIAREASPGLLSSSSSSKGDRLSWLLGVVPDGVLAKEGVGGEDEEGG